MKLPSFTMQRLRDIALGTIIALNALATAVSFGESYFGLYRWATEHGVAGFWGGVWPMMVDLIILVAEAALFVAHYDNWRTRHKAWLWTVLFTALGISTGANTGHVHSTDYLSHMTAALPPLALAFTMTVGFGVMKRTFLNKPVIVPATKSLTKAELEDLRAKLNEITPARETPIGVARETPLNERSHVGETPWSETPALSEFETSQPAGESETAPETATTQDISETMVKLGFKATEKSYVMPRDTREGLSLAEKRVRDMYDVDYEITPNAAATALGISWATAKKYLDATKEARGISE